MTHLYATSKGLKLCKNKMQYNNNDYNSSNFLFRHRTHFLSFSKKAITFLRKFKNRNLKIKNYSVGKKFICKVTPTLMI